jgi:hypothetical protein
VRDSFGWSEIPSAILDFKSNLLNPAGSTNNKFVLFIFAGVSWLSGEMHRLGVLQQLGLWYYVR